MDEFGSYLNYAECSNSYKQNNLGWCLNSAEDDNSDGQNSYLNYAKGGNSYDQNSYLKSAEDDNSSGQNNLGWCLNSVEGNDLNGQNNLGICIDKEKWPVQQPNQGLILPAQVNIIHFMIY